MTSKVRKILTLGIGTLVIVGGIGISGIKSGVGEADMVSIGNEPVAMSGEDPDEIEELETEEPEEEPEEEEEQEEPEEEAEEPEEETEEDSQSGSEESEEESADAGEDENALLGADDSNNKIEVSASEITIDDSKLVYDGNPQLPTVKYNGTTLTKDNDYTIEVNGGDAVDAGSYHARITLKGEYTCQDTIERNFTIAKAKAIADGRLKPNITVDGDTITIKNTTTLCQYKVIEGTSATASELGETGDEVDESGEVIKKEKLVDGKTYAVYYRVKGSDNYEAGEWKLVTTAKIEILPLVTQLPTANKLTYNGTDQELVTAGTTNQGTIKYATEKEGQYSTTIPTGKNAGSYTVWWVIDSDSSNKDSTPVSVSVTIAKKQVTVSGTISATKKYDGKIKAEVDWTKLTLSGVIDGDEVSVTGTASFENAKAGTNKKITATGLKLEGAAKDNYTLKSTSLTGKGTIEEQEEKAKETKKTETKTKEKKTTENKETDSKTTEKNRTTKTDNSKKKTTTKKSTTTRTSNDIVVENTKEQEMQKVRLEIKERLMEDYQSQLPPPKNHIRK